MIAAALALSLFLDVVVQATPPTATAQPVTATAGPLVVTTTARFKLVEEPLSLPRGKIQGLRDLDGDGRVDLYGTADDGQAILVRRQKEPGVFGAVERLPVHDALACVADVDPAPGEEVVVADERGVRYFRIDGGRFSPEPVTITTGGLDYPPEGIRWADFLVDLDKDGRPDLLVPRRGRYELRLQRAPGRFDEPRPIPIEIGRNVKTGGGEPGAAIASEFVVPKLELADLNGDGRDDIIVRDDGKNRYYLAAADGTFPAEPSFTLAVDDFRDPADAARPEGVLEMLDNLRFTQDTIDETDLDGDGICDYVVLTASRVVAFRGTSAGVNTADPWQILRFGAAVGNLFLFDMNDDGRKDLVAVRLDIPPLPRLVVGIFAGFTVDLRVLAFYTGQDGRFSRKPDRSNTLHLEVPPIIDIVRHPDEYKKKFENLKSIRWRPDEIAEVDLDGDGRAEALIFEERGVTVRAPETPIGRRREPERIGRTRLDPGGIAAIADEFVFNPERSTYSVDTLPKAIEDLARIVRTTGEARRAAADAAPMVAAGALRIEARSVEVRDVDGDGRVDVILRNGEKATVLWNRKP